VGQDGLEEDTKGFGFGFSNWRLRRKVRKLIRAVDILEERLSTNEVSTEMHMHYAMANIIIIICLI
jgi:hypothetical protein